MVIVLFVEGIAGNGTRIGEVADFENKTSYQKLNTAILPNRCYALVAVYLAGISIGSRFLLFFLFENQSIRK